MKFKKLFASAVAMSMAMSMSLPAFAADDTYSSLNRDTKITSTLTSPTIKIVVPTTGSVILNPYQMEVDFESAKSQDLILSSTQYIENYSDINIKVQVAAAAVPDDGSDIELTDEAVEEDSTEKEVFLQLEMAVVNDNSSTVNWSSLEAVDKNEEEETQAVSGEKAVLTLTDSKDDALDMLTLAAGDGTSAAVAGGFSAFHLAGDMVSVPETPWTEDDTLTVALTFTFVPVALDVTP